MKELPPRQKRLIEFLQKHEWVCSTDPALGLAEVTNIVKALEAKGYSFERRQHRTGRLKHLCYEFKLTGYPEKQKTVLTPTQSEVLKAFQKGEWLRESDVSKFTSGICKHVERLATKGCVFAKRPYKCGKGIGTEYKLMHCPEGFVFTERSSKQKSPGRKPRRVKNPKVCNIARKCAYGARVSVAGWHCDYLWIKGHCRPCLPAECREKGVFKPRGRNKAKKERESKWVDTGGSLLESVYELNAIMCRGGKK